MKTHGRHRDDERDPELFPGVVGDVGGEALVHSDQVVHHLPAPDGILEIEEDVEAFAGDENLMNPGSPEFEHLTRPAPRPCR